MRGWEGNRATAYDVSSVRTISGEGMTRPGLCSDYIRRCPLALRGDDHRHRTEAGVWGVPAALKVLAAVHIAA